ncbi:folliculin-interacting protein 1 [Chelonus insularis]|uniref:folliculin-interacting protein 1 n=1 Tax=Chelonus insularis TaxID=460826 RepID=UPI00158DDCD7|nr:folliculin-interacting protein 1 [Chelonus insularis]
MMPLFNKFLSTKTNNNKNNTRKESLNIDFEVANRKKLHFEAEQVRILLFRECEWRGKRLLFDSVSLSKQTLSNSDQNVKKTCTESNSCPRNGNGLPLASEKDPCDNISLLSEMIFGTVAMTYRGPLFKVHLLDDPRCIMCTKVFPASDHNPHKQSNGVTSTETTKTSTNFDSNSSNGSSRNTLSSPSSGNFSGSSLRKSSTCSSTCSGWDIDVLHPGSSQSLEINSNSSSGFSSFSSFRRRWLRAMSTSLSLTDSDEIFGFQPYGDTSGNICDFNTRRHKTRLGLALLIKLTPGQERQMETQLLEHVAHLEAILNRLCYTCMERNGKKTDEDKKGLLIRLHYIAYRCTMWLLRLFMPSGNNGSPSIWHQVLLNSSICIDTRIKMLYCSFQQMCQLLNNFDTKSTNFFISTVITAVLTYHLGWVNTIMSPRDKTWIENIKTKFSYNPFWAQLGDLYGALGNPAKFVHTVIVGSSEKVTLINTILTFLTYFIRSAIVTKHYEERDSPETGVQEAINILKQIKKKHSSTTNTLKNIRFTPRNNDHCESSSSRLNIESTSGLSRSPKNLSDVKSMNSSGQSEKKEKATLNIPKLRKISSLNSNLDSHPSNLQKTESKLSLELQPRRNDLSDFSICSNGLEKNSTSSSVKIIVSEIASQEFEGEKNVPRVSVFDDLELKDELRDSQSLSLTPKLPILEDRRGSTLDETDVYFSQVEYTDDKRNQVFFTLGGEEKPPVADRLPQDNNCQCSFAFNRVPSTSAQLPEGVLRKILQRNFPESSKSIQRPPSSSFSKERPFGLCPKCNGNGNYEGSKLLLETPTNATEVLRTCGSSMTTRGARPRCIDSLEELLEVNEVIELPMPRSKNSTDPSVNLNQVSGFTDTLIRKTVTETADGNHLFYDSGYTTGLVIQGLKKKNNKGKDIKINEEKYDSGNNDEEKNNLIKELREEVSINARYPIVDHTVSESVCILADVDNWQVGIISNNMPLQSQLLPVGMSRLVSDMLEAFVYLWTKYRSPVHCLNILETKLREIWLRSETLAKMLMSVDVCEMSLANLTSTLDLDAADIPLLLAVATTHSPQIAQRFGFTLT